MEYFIMSVYLIGVLYLFVALPLIFKTIIKIMRKND